MSLLLTIFLFTQMQDSLNMCTIGCWPFGTPGWDMCPVSESILYIGCGRGLYVLDVSNPGSITLLDSLTTPGSLSRVMPSISNNYCLSGRLKAGVVLYDISNKSHPHIVSTYLTPSVAGTSQLIGRYGFIAANGLRILDYADPYHPVEIGKFETPNWTKGVFVKDNYAYLADEAGGFRIIDISDLNNPVEVFHYETGYFTYGIWVEDTFAYIAWGNKGLRIWNVKDPYAPFEVASYGDDMYYVKVIDTIAYCVRFGVLSPYIDYLYILNVANPSHPQLITRYGRSPNTDLWANISGNRGYILLEVSTFTGPDTLIILDLSDLRNPTPLGYFTRFHALTDGVFVQGDYLYAATRGQGMKIYDISEPTSPRPISQIGSCYVERIVVRDSLAYLTCARRPVLAIVDVSDPHNPRLLGTLDSSGGCSAITIQDSLAFIAGYGQNVRIVNISDPREPRQIGVIPVSSRDPGTVRFMVIFSSSPIFLVIYLFRFMTFRTLLNRSHSAVTILVVHCLMWL